jgi:DNA-directed RNA polymerase II subunit RPB1
MADNCNYKPSSKIIGIQFSVLSPEEICRNSVLEITSRDTYISNRPVSGGLFDPKMGVLEPGTICPTDGMTYIDTPGYFGHITLAKPVFFIQHLKEIVKICKCICYKCSKLLLHKENHRHALLMSNEQRWDYVYNIASKIKRCGDASVGCGCLQPDKIKLEGMSSIIATWESIVSDVKLLPERILTLFQRISDDDVHFMGFSPDYSRPDWFICQHLPIAPPAVRPSVKVDAQQRSEDDLTHIYNVIIKSSLRK